jgi:amino acid transporter/nucleotide-binding universal stress UspA family protein
MAFVGWAYTHICRIFPDGGGVYSAAKQVSHRLAVAGALLLIAGYVVMAAISALDAFYYLGATDPWPWTIVALLLIGGIHAYGPRRVGNLGLLIAILTVALFLVIAGFTAPHLASARFERPPGGLVHHWVNFVGVILALSGVESVANMTGIMDRPVPRTSALSIWPVLLEVALINIVLTLAMCAMDAAKLQNHTEDMVRVIAQYYVGNTFAKASSVVFALLLLSAANRAVGAIVSVIFQMGRDGELPKGLTGLNRYGVPWIALIVATLLPIVTLIFERSVNGLAPLYAIGVAGAITINIGACAFVKTTAINLRQRIMMAAVVLVMGAIFVTLAVVKISALIFTLLILAGGLGARFAAQAWPRFRLAYPAPLPELLKEMLAPTEQATPRRVIISPEQPRLLLATRGGERSLRYAVDEAQRRNAALFVLFVRELAVPFPDRERTLARLEEDKEAQDIFLKVRELAKEKEVPVIPIYDSGISAAEAILDHAVTLGVDCLIMGVSKRGALWRAVKGNIIREVMEILPEQITLLLHS